MSRKSDCFVGVNVKYAAIVAQNGVSITVGMGMGMGMGKGQGEHHSPTVIIAGNKAELTSGGNTNLIGASVHGQRVELMPVRLNISLPAHLVW